MLAASIIKLIGAVLAPLREFSTQVLLTILLYSLTLVMYITLTWKFPVESASIAYQLGLLNGEIGR